MSAEEATCDVIEKQLPALKEAMGSGRLEVDNVDVFCESGVFDIEQSRRILEEGKKIGLQIDFPGDELHAMKAAEVRARPCILLRWIAAKPVPNAFRIKNKIDML